MKTQREGTNDQNILAEGSQKHRSSGTNLPGGSQKSKIKAEKGRMVQRRLTAEPRANM